jgi:hypothetical protein
MTYTNMLHQFGLTFQIITNHKYQRVIVEIPFSLVHRPETQYIIWTKPLY